MTVCPSCSAEHDPRPCARDSVACDCCSALYSSPEDRAAACEALDADEVNR